MCLSVCTYRRGVQHGSQLSLLNLIFLRSLPAVLSDLGRVGGLLVVMQSLDPWGPVPGSGSVVESKQAQQGRGAVGATFPLQELALQSAVTSSTASPGPHPVPEQP